MDPITEKILEFLHTNVPPLIRGKKHVRYSSTTPPIPYDYHMPSWLQPIEMEYSPGLSSKLTEHLVSVLSERKSIVHQSMVVDPLIDRASFLMDNMVPSAPKVVGELTVTAVQTRIHHIAGIFATLSCFDIENDEIRRLRSVFTAGPSPESDAKADLVVGFEPIPEDAPEKWKSLRSSVIQPRDLRDPFFGVLYTEEHKNILSAGPLVILGIYTIIWKFIKLHNADTEDIPVGSCLLDAYSATEDLGAANLEELRAEITRIIELAKDYNAKYDIPTKPGTRTVKRKREDTDTEDDSQVEEQFVPYRELLDDAMNEAREELQLPPEMKGAMILNSAYMLIQVKYSCVGL
ncbi:hypothetical protein B0H12DRAFT_1132857 [Mycena haematopus]|nr:hypothetical protein B0H12DRAFT_1132857 [Mycena haematopus]